jgi:hypothetical protein
MQDDRELYITLKDSVKNHKARNLKSHIAVQQITVPFCRHFRLSEGPLRRFACYNYFLIS